MGRQGGVRGYNPPPVLTYVHDGMNSWELQQEYCESRCLPNCAETVYHYTKEEKTLNVDVLCARGAKTREERILRI